MSRIASTSFGWVENKHVFVCLSTLLHELHSADAKQILMPPCNLTVLSRTFCYESDMERGKSV